MTGGDILSFLSGKGTVIYHEVHSNGRLRNLLEGDCLRVLWRADGIPDMDIRNTGNGNDGADFCLLNLHTL